MGRGGFYDSSRSCFLFLFYWYFVGRAAPVQVTKHDRPRATVLGLVAEALICPILFCEGLSGWCVSVHWWPYRTRLDRGAKV